MKLPGCAMYRALCLTSCHGNWVLSTSTSSFLSVSNIMISNNNHSMHFSRVLQGFSNTNILLSRAIKIIVRSLKPGKFDGSEAVSKDYISHLADSLADSCFPRWPCLLGTGSLKVKQTPVLNSL